MARMRTAFLLPVLWVAVSSSPGSAQSRPDVRAGRAALEQSVTERSNGVMRVTSFTKTDGQAGEVQGVKTYKMFFRAVVRFVEDDTCYSGALSTSCAGGHVQMVSSLQHVRVEGYIDFERSERGWHSNGVTLTKASEPEPHSSPSR